MELKTKFRVENSTLLNNCKFFYRCCLIYVCLYGCSGNEQIGWQHVLNIDKSIKSNPIQLKAEIVEPSLQFINAKDFFVYKDSVLIVLNKASQNNSFVVFYNLNTDSDIAKFIHLGNGPGEMLNCIAHIRNNNLYVHDFVKNMISIINIDSVLNYKADYKLEPFIKFSNNIGSPFITMYNPNELILLNPYCFADKQLKIDNKQPRFIISDINKDVGLTLKDKLYYTYNVSQGVIIPNANKNRLVFASCFISEIEFYDYSLNPILKINGPDKLIASYRSNENNDISFDKVIPYSYMNYSCDDDNIYLSYVGDYLTDGKNLRDFDSFIIELDWDGKIGRVYHSPEYVNTISKSNNKDVFYGRGFNEDGIVLWKLSRL